MSSDSYLDVAGWKTRTIMPSANADALDASAPGFLAARLKFHTSRMNVRLRKRYAAPFADPVPEVVLGWLDALVTVDAYQKLGWNPADEQAKEVIDARTTALAEIKEAADSKDGLFDLPLRQDTTEEGIAMGAPLGYSEPDAYEWTDAQAEAVRGR